MKVQEIFNSTAVRSIEEQIISLYQETERNHWYNDENKKAIRCFLELRQQILDSMFVLDEKNKKLLAEFNEAIKQQLIEMRKRAIDLYNNVYSQNRDGGMRRWAFSKSSTVSSSMEKRSVVSTMRKVWP